MIPQFNAYVSGGKPLFLLNNAYDITQANEANLFNNLASEHQYLYGTDCIFISRETYKEETVFGEFLSAVFEKGIPIRMYLEETEAWSGSGDIYTKIGLQVTDEATLWTNKTSFHNACGVDTYPKQGDLFYIPKTKKVFEIAHIENEVAHAFYLLGNDTGYKISCKLFTYNHEKIVQDIDSEIPTGIPEAIQALDSLLDGLNDEPVTLEQKEYNNNNAVIQNEASTVIDSTEEDPLGF